MRVLIMSDMEDVSGIVARRGEQVSGGSPMHEEGQRLCAEEIHSCDCHCLMAGL